MKPYVDDAHALDDALRLSRAMTYKWAFTGLPPGGAKTVVIGDPAREKTPQLLRALGRAIDSLRGDYIAGSDVGTSDEDMRVIQEVTPHVRGADVNHGDSSEATAYGVYQGMLAAVEAAYSKDSVRNLRVAVQGLGHVGKELCRTLFDSGAELFVADKDPTKAHDVARDYRATIVAPDEILRADVDILAPCALGGILDERSARDIHARVICGAANNQLAHASVADDLHRRGILFCPDYVVNAGGVINGSAEGPSYNKEKVWRHLDKIRDRCRHIFEHARSRGISSQSAADEIAAGIIANRHK